MAGERRRAAALLTAIALAWATNAVAQRRADPYATVLNGPSTVDGVYEANGELSRRGCRDTACRALDNIAAGFEVIEQRQFPNSMAQLLPPERRPDPDKVADAKLRRLLLSHPNRRPYYCAILTKIAQHDSQADDLYYETCAREA